MQSKQKQARERARAAPSTARPAPSPNRTFTPTTVVSLLLLVAAAVILTRLLIACWPSTVDDAFITFRYAKNLAAGQGPTFNPGGPPAEGYTTLTWMLLMTIPHLLGVDVVVFSKVMGILATLAFMVGTFQFVRAGLSRRFDSESRTLAAACTVLLLCAFSPTGIHAVAGMETALFTALFVAFAASLARLQANEIPWGTAALGLAMGLTRPEGHLAAFVGWAVAIALAPPALRRASIKAVAAAHLAPFVLYVIWRWRYYGVPFPLPYYIKVASPSGLAGLDDFIGFVKALGLPLVALAVVGLRNVQREQLPAFVAAASLLVFFLVPATIMSFDWRYLYPISPFVFMLAAAGLLTLVGLLARPLGATRVRTVGLVAMVAIFGWMSWRLGANAEARAIARQGAAKAIDDTYVTLAKVLDSMRSESSTPVLAIADAGVIPYYSGWRTVDVTGLNDATIARSGNNPVYVVAQRPDLVILNSRNWDAFEERTPGMADLYNACVQSGLTRVRVDMLRHDYFPWILGNPTNPVVAEFVRRSDARSPAQPIANVEIQCARCGTKHEVQMNLEVPSPLKAGRLPYPADDRLVCPRCGTVQDIAPRRRYIEARTGKRVVPQSPEPASP